ncbi:SDR family oxidoreductase [Lederbergia citrea]|uniref:SDR family oxidoreductase n=1 Tax=Lederbergia citrea TaxID=2833581 RepID=UPI001BC9C4C3|nr:SDR family oxidoreductase [Lederbergia citrea]MBS4205057.1 SDR family oxidoreductase [Lederbergia citrea]
MTSLKGKLALVTGVSRTKGIGAAICRKLAANGVNIIFTYWTDYDEEMPWGMHKDEPSIIQEELNSLGINCAKIELDLKDVSSIKRVFDFSIEQFNAYPDILVNNAAFSVNDNINTITKDNLDHHYYVNVRATTLLCAEFVNRFSKDSGRIINITTGWSLGQMPEELSYVLTKSSVETLTYTLSSTLAEKGITINAVNPGPTDSGWMNDKIKKDLLTRFPAGRLGQPEDVAKLILFLVSEEAQWITGQLIHSEGGFRNADD